MYIYRHIFFGTAEVCRQRSNITKQTERMQEKYRRIQLYIDCSQHPSIKFAAEIALLLSMSIFHVVLLSEHTDINPAYSFQCTEKRNGKQFYFFVSVEKSAKHIRKQKLYFLKKFTLSKYTNCYIVC
jgi:hypothetical protein